VVFIADRSLLPGDPGGQTEAQKKGLYEMPFGELWSKGISIRSAGAGSIPAF
jgi:hypothetical protein